MPPEAHILGGVVAKIRSGVIKNLWMANLMRWKSLLCGDGCNVTEVVGWRNTGEVGMLKVGLGCCVLLSRKKREGGEKAALDRRGLGVDWTTLRVE